MSEITGTQAGTPETAPETKPKVLFVDDEAAILSSLQRLLRKEAYEFHSATSPIEALNLVSSLEFAAIVSDHRMPEMEGTLFLEQAKQVSPETIRILLTGYADLGATVDAINKGSVYRFLSKPWNDQELVMTVRQAVAQFGLVAENRRLQELTSRQNEALLDLNRNLEEKVEQRTAETVKLHRDLEKSFLGSVKALAGFTELNSPHIGSHSRRVAANCKIMAKLMGLSSGDAMQLEVAALLHDIGELTVPADILRKQPSLLKAPEMKIWEKHAILGEGVLRMVPHFEKASKMVRCHHESFNGSGFPDRLKGQAIPLGARIISVADAYDGALNSKVNYALASPEKALAWLQGRAGMEFDPAVVEALGAALREGQSPEDRNEIQVSLGGLREGMVLSRDIRSHLGVLLLSRKTVLVADHLARIAHFLLTEQIEAGDAFILRNPEETGKPGKNGPGSAPLAQPA